MTIVLPINVAQLREKAKAAEARLNDIGTQLSEALLSHPNRIQVGDEIEASSEVYGGDYKSAVVRDVRVITRTWNMIPLPVSQWYLGYIVNWKLKTGQYSDNAKSKELTRYVRRIES